MTCRIGRNPTNPSVAHLHARNGSVRLVEIDELTSSDPDQRKCPNCMTSMRPISAAGHHDRFGQQVYQCDDCLGKVRFSLKKHPQNATGQPGTHQ